MVKRLVAIFGFLGLSFFGVFDMFVIGSVDFDSIDALSGCFAEKRA